MGLSFARSLGALGAASRAGDIAKSAEFFSFGANDLTQTTLGVLTADPFVTLDQEGVGELIKIAAERGRAPQVGAASIAFCESMDLEYVC